MDGALNTFDRQAHTGGHRRRHGRGSLNRRTRSLAIAGLALALTVVAGGGSALASPPTLTLSGAAANGGTPDSYGISTIKVSATKTGSLVGGTLETGGRTGGIGNFSHYEFSGKVTCMVMSKGRMFVGAFGTAAFHEEKEGTENIIPLAGTYMQVAEVQFVNYKETGPGGEFTVRHEYGSLGEHHRGLSSKVKPKCPEWLSLTSSSGPAFEDSLALSPSITKPKDGFVSTTGTVKFAGQGEPNTFIGVYPVGHPEKAIFVAVNAVGNWALTIGGLSVGTHEYVASPVEGPAGLSNTVGFKVS
jgi:hypothetical protein